MPIYKPTSNIAMRDRKKRSIFLAGSIDLGKAIEWQKDAEKYLDPNLWNIFNPRGDDFDPTTVQSFDNPVFYHQVLWELEGLEQADVILMVFDPNAMSPISLLELGLFAKSKKIRVVCPKGFWRKGNVDIICHLYNIPLYENMEDALKDISATRIPSYSSQYKCQYKGSTIEKECAKVRGRCLICKWYE